MAAPRMTRTTRALLATFLDADCELHGLELIRASGLSAGAFYPALQWLLAAGWVTARWEPDEVAESEQRPPRRYYELTAQGRARAGHALCNAKGPARVAPLLRLIDPATAARTAAGTAAEAGA